MTQLLLSRRRSIHSSTSSVNLLDSANSLANLDDERSDDEQDSNASTVDAAVMDMTSGTSACVLEDSIESLLACGSQAVLSSPFARLTTCRTSRRKDSRSRLRRSKSVPVEAAQRVCELTPAKCFSQSTQTPLRRAIAKVLSGEDEESDWGSSQASCATSIQCLQDLHSRARAHTTGDMSTSSRSPYPSHHTFISPLSGTLLSSSPPAYTASPYAYIASPRDHGKTSRLASSLTPSFSNTMKYISPLVSSMQSLIRSPLAHRMSSRVSIDFDCISEDISLARRAVQSLRTTARGSSLLNCADKKKCLSKSWAKIRRVSAGLLSRNTMTNASTSPALVPDSRVNNRLHFPRDSEGRNGLESIRTAVTVFSHTQFIRTDHVCMTATSFKGVIIGGTYRSCFDRGLPVVRFPSTHEKRIASCRMTAENGLTLDLYMGINNDMKTVCLGRDWCCIRAAPDGYIVFKNTPIFGLQFESYFLPKDPIEWIKTDSAYSVPSPRKVKFEELTCRMDVDDAAEDDDNMSTVSTINLSSSGSYLELYTASDDLHMADRVGPERNIYANWSDVNVICLVLDFLIGGANSSRRSCQKNDDIISHMLPQAEVLCYKTVSKAWAIGYYMHMSKLQIHSKNAVRKDYSDWSDFVRGFSMGEQVSGSACKEVFRVHNRHADKAQAVR